MPKVKKNEKDKKDEKDIKKVDTLDVARKSIVKKYGEGVISFLGEHEDLTIDAISTGCLSLDAATGIGGFARGRLYEIFGPNSTGKSTLALSVIMQALKRGLKGIVYLDNEHSIDPQLVRNMGKEIGIGADVDKIELVQAFCGDDSLEIAEKFMKTGEVDVLVVDSVSALLPKSMAEGEIGDNYIGMLARLVSKGCLKLTPVANRTNTLLIFINQIRHQIGKWGDTRVPTGGESLSFYSTGRLKVEGGESKTSRIVDEEGVVVGHRCGFTIIKNKLSAPWRTASIDLIYGKGYNFKNEIIDLAIDFGVIDQKGAWFYYDGEKYLGKPTLVDLFEKNNEIYEAVKNAVKKILGLI
jgi:recombination protein RecA